MHDQASELKQLVNHICAMPKQRWCLTDPTLNYGQVLFYRLWTETLGR